MKSILVIGAGRSSSALISYLLRNAAENSWKVRVGDMNEDFARARVEGYTSGEAFRFDIQDAAQREREISSADLVVSMLPAFMHGAVAKDCVRLGKHLVTASYVSDEMRALHEEAKNKGVTLLNEIGLDPGIDHMSAMEIMDEIRGEGGEMKAFYSYCGGLVAPESNDNPWGYKFSWNPRNVILAGQGTAQYIQNGQYKYLPYSRLYTQARTLEVKGHGKFDAYANRDSLSYRGVYGIEQIPTMLRGTLRMEGFCKAWNVFVQLGITDDSWKMKGLSKMTYKTFVESFLPEGDQNVKEKLALLCGLSSNDEALDKVEWTGILSDEKIPMEEGSPAQVLQQLLEKKWVLKPGDKDMVVMQHIFEYEMDGASRQIKSSLVVIGDDEVHTAMAKTVGLPAAIGVKLILNGTFTQRGVVVPVMKELYQPVLHELKEYGIVFKEERN